MLEFETVKTRNFSIRLETSLPKIRNFSVKD